MNRIDKYNKIIKDQERQKELLKWYESEISKFEGYKANLYDFYTDHEFYFLAFKRSDFSKHYKDVLKFNEYFYAVKESDEGDQYIEDDWLIQVDKFNLEDRDQVLNNYIDVLKSRAESVQNWINLNNNEIKNIKAAIKVDINADDFEDRFITALLNKCNSLDCTSQLNRILTDLCNDMKGANDDLTFESWTKLEEEFKKILLNQLSHTFHYNDRAVDYLKKVENVKGDTNLLMRYLELADYYKRKSTLKDSKNIFEVANLRILDEFEEKASNMYINVLNELLFN